MGYHITIYLQYCYWGLMIIEIILNHLTISRGGSVGNARECTGSRDCDNTEVSYYWFISTTCDCAYERELDTMYLQQQLLGIFNFISFSCHNLHSQH